MATYFTVTDKQKVSSVGGLFVGPSVLLNAYDVGEDSVFQDQLLYKSDIATGTIVAKTGDLDLNDVGS